LERLPPNAESYHGVLGRLSSDCLQATSADTDDLVQFLVFATSFVCK
jgi:hypothetical protein